ncbi:MAG: glycosyltransferase [Hyphomonas sp.]|nr:glycosyltransferase [Hyphomonas sp.]
MKRLLLLTRHYPSAVSGGVRRPYLLAAALRRKGVDVRIVAPSLPEGEPGLAVPHPNRDPSDDTGPARPSLRGIARDLLLWPDPDIRWCQRAADAAIAEGWKPEWVLSTSPPESIHVAAERLARALGARWAADFRDLWLEAPHRTERRRLHRRIGEGLLARKLLPKADLVLAVDQVVAAEAGRLGARGPQVLEHFTSEDVPAPFAYEGSGLNILHAGSIALSDPEACIDDLLAPFEAATALRSDLVLNFAGRLTAAEKARIAASPAAPGIRQFGPVPYETARAMMAGADALAFVASGKMHVPPSKIVDYLAFDLPLVACGEGPWRTDLRVPTEPAAGVLNRLTRGAGRNTSAAPRYSDAAASRFLDLCATYCNEA